MSRLDPPLDSPDRAAWLRRHRQSDSRTALSELLGDCHLPPSELLDLACIDLLACWRAGHAIAAEHYLDQFHVLANDAEFVLDLIDAEVCARQERGQTVTTEDLERRFPSLAGRLQQLVSVDTLETSLDEVSDFSFDGSHKKDAKRTQGDDRADRAADANRLELQHEPPPQSIDWERYCNVDLPGDVRLTGLFALRDEVVCLRAMRADNQPIVVKVVAKRRLPDRDAATAIGDALERLATIEHRAIVAPEAVAESASQFALIRPYVLGSLWTERMRRGGGSDSASQSPQGPSRWNDSLRDWAEVAYAVAAIHALGLSHGSLHPQNVLREPTGKLQVVDAGFGFPSPALQWTLGLAATPPMPAKGQLADVRMLARWIDWAITPNRMQPNDSPPATATALSHWCAAMWRNEAPLTSISQLADTAMAVADGRSPTIPGDSKWSRWWGR